MITRAQCQPGLRVRVVDADRVVCIEPLDRRTHAGILAGVVGREGIVLERRRSAHRGPGEPTYLFARVRLDHTKAQCKRPEHERTARHVVHVPLAGLDAVAVVVETFTPIELP